MHAETQIIVACIILLFIVIITATYGTVILLRLRNVKRCDMYVYVEFNAPISFLLARIWKQLYSYIKYTRIFLLERKGKTTRLSPFGK